MKLVVVGATGLVGTEVIRQAPPQPSCHLCCRVCSQTRPAAWPHKCCERLQTFVSCSRRLDNPLSRVSQRAIKGSDACIWTLAVTPSKSKDMDFTEVTKIFSDYTLTGLKNMAALANQPFRFIYTSGITIERDQTAELPILAEYRLMRCRVENSILEFAEQHAPDVQATVTEPGAIDGPNREASMNDIVKLLFDMYGYTRRVHVSEPAAAMIDQCLNGITKDPLPRDGLRRLGNGY
ncbi:hypothetical protein LSUE1_G002265 [Lachnellula suecica]|uniref:Uncharacterized protein n=1 Tax=Lachnellula suecica TaxID=602035 RepID=A0A8T9CB03_9HELO|nr:hypothetical protein LSUE1_G002265 [Lachnellula suecica]